MHLYLNSGSISPRHNYKKGLKGVSYFILGVVLSNVLTKRRIWDMYDQSEAVWGGSDEQVLLPNKKNTLYHNYSMCKV